MPIYEYKCENKNCGAKIECLQKISDEPIKICPECKEQSLRRLISAAGFRLKGGGWYETDFKGSQDKKKNLSNNSDSSSNTETRVQDSSNTQGSNSKVESSTTTTKSDSQSTTK
jgi:putative FmdB family regulatory protein